MRVPRFAVFSPVLPPLQGGQPIILQRLLAGSDPAEFCLIGSEFYHHQLAHLETLPSLAAQTYWIPAATPRPLPRTTRKELLQVPLDFVREVSARARFVHDVLTRERIEVLVVCTGDLYSFAACAVAARRAGAACVPYFFDDLMHQTGPRLVPLAFLVERLALRSSQRSIVTNEAAAALLAGRHGVSSDVVYNAAPAPDLGVLDAAPSPFTAPGFHLVFAGNIYEAHYDAFTNLAQALALVDDLQVRLHIYAPQTAEQLRERGIASPCFEFHGFQPHAVVEVAERKADALFLPLAFKSRLTPLLRTAAPGKTAEYLAMGRPVLVHAPQGSFLSEYFTRRGCGAVVDRCEPAALADAIRRLAGERSYAAALAAAGPSRYREDFSIEAARERFFAVLAKAG